MPLPAGGGTDELLTISEEAFAYIEDQVEGVDVQAAMLNERLDPGNVLTPCVDVAWIILGLPGLFFCHPKYVKGWPEIASKEILFKKEKVQAIYEGLAEAPWLVGSLPPLRASFTQSVPPLGGTTVTFTDTSTPGPSGPITAWRWDFGDSQTSSEQNPVHAYAVTGLYGAKLTVTGTSPDGTNATFQDVILV